MISNSFSLQRYRLRMHISAACFCGLFAALQYFSSAARVNAVRAERSSQLDDQQLIVSQADSLQDRLKVLEAEEQQLTATLTALRELIPDHTQEHAFMEQLACHAEECDMDTQEFRPGSPAYVGQFERVAKDPGYSGTRARQVEIIVSWSTDYGARLVPIPFNYAK